jgi:VanZ family protein
VRPSLTARYRYLPPLAWMALIYGFSDRPDLPQVGVGWQDFVVKKSLHALAYALLFRFWLRALAPEGRASPTAEAQALAICLLWAASDEWHQTFVPGRTGRVRDVAIDAVGALAAMAVLRRRRPDRQ